MKAMCIWTKDDEKNIMKLVNSMAELKNAKVSGRKPDKIITRPQDLGRTKANELKKYIAYDGQIVIGDKVVYDGKHGLK